LSHDTFSDDDQSVSYIKDKPDICKPIIYDEDTIQSTDSTNSNSLDPSSYDDATHAHNDIDIEIYNVTEDVTYNIPLPKCKRTATETPTTICTAKTIGAVRSHKILRILLDSGSRKTLIKRSALPRGTKPKKLSTTKTLTTLAGNVAAAEIVTLRDIRLPEFDKNRRIEEQKALVFDAPCRYDIIFGTDFLTKVGININYETGFMEWYECILPLRDPFTLDKESYQDMEDAMHVQTEDELLGEDWLDNYATEILDAKYNKTDVNDVVKQQSHLTATQKKDLLELLTKHSKLFSGKLGSYPHKKFHIDIDPEATPVHARAYPVPRIHLETFRNELNHLVELGVLQPQGVSEWASPSFIIPKKDGRVRWISDLRQLNKVIKRKQYPLPIINDILRKRIGYKFFSKLDISMQYYTFELDEDSQDLCTIVTPFGKYKYTRLPMGLKCSPDFAQEVMENVLRGIDDSDVYLDDVGAFSNTWEHHMDLLDEILDRLTANGFTVNPLKCEWAVQETDWLGYWLTPRGLKPWRKKIEAILHLDRPRTPKALRSFIGAVNFYRDMWPSRAHVLKPLTDKSGLKKRDKLDWTDEMQIAFVKMKKLMAADALSAYPNHNLRFDIYTDASDYQLGACIMQNGRPVAYFTKKLSDSQKNYTTMEKELLSIVATLQEFRSMLLGANIHIWTDHKNLTFDTLNTQRVLRWRSYVEEYSPILHYIEGEKNILADNLSRLHRLPTPDDIKSGTPMVDPTSVTEIDEVEGYFLDQHYSGISDDDITDMFECYLNIPEQDSPEENPLNYGYIREQQQADARLLARQEKYPEQYINISLDDDVDDIICYVRPTDNQNQWRIALPEQMLDKTISWFHQIMGHPGSKRLRETLQKRYYHPQLRRTVDKYQCEHCQKHKLSGKGYGLLPERELRVAPWTEVAVDLIGPWKLQVHGKPVEFNALTCIDTASNLVELIRIDNKSCPHVTEKFKQAWIARYPLMQRCVHDMGGEFTGGTFQRLLTQLNIKDAQSTSKNPQSNSICERMHQTVGNILRTLLYSNPPQNMAQARDIIDSALATAMHAMRTTVATTLGSTPGALAFSRDMFLNVPLVADWQTIAQNREQFINENLRRANARRRQYDYAPNQQVLKKVHDPTKLGVRTTGPFTILRVHVNGTITLQLRPGVTERINIRRVIPFRTTPPTDPT